MQVSVYIDQLLAAGKTQSALQLLQSLTEKEHPNQHQELVLLAATFAKTVADSNKGAIRRSEEMLGINKINLAISDISRQLPPDRVVAVSGSKVRGLQGLAFIIRYYPFLLFGCWFIFLGIYLFLATQIRSGVLVEMDIMTNRLGMQIINDEKLNVERELASLLLTRFKKVDISARRIQLQTGMTPAESHLISRGWISLYPQTGIESDLFLDSVTLKSLRFTKNTTLTLGLPDEPDIHTPQVEMILQPGHFKGELSFQDSLGFQASNILIEKEEGELQTVQLANAKVYIPPAQAYPITIESDQEQFQMILELKPGSGHTIKENNLLVDSLRFLRPDGPGKAKSSIISGQVRFLNEKQETYDVAQIDSLDFFRIQGESPLQLVVFNLEEEAIRLRLAGEVDALLISTDMKTWSKQNPSSWTWIWKNKPLWFWLPLFLLLMTSAGLWLVVRNRYRL